MVSFCFCFLIWQSSSHLGRGISVEGLPPSDLRNLNSWIMWWGPAHSRWHHAWAGSPGLYKKGKGASQGAGTNRRALCPHDFCPAPACVLAPASLNDQLWSRHVKPDKPFLPELVSVSVYQQQKTTQDTPQVLCLIRVQLSRWSHVQCRRASSWGSAWGPGRHSKLKTGLGCVSPCFHMYVNMEFSLVNFPNRRQVTRQGPPNGLISQSWRGTSGNLRDLYPIAALVPDVCFIALCLGKLNPQDAWAFCWGPEAAIKK